MSPRHRQALIAFAFTGLTLFVFLGVHRHEFVNFDDENYITHNPGVQDGLTAASVRWAFTTFHAANWHPLTWLSLQLDYQLYGPNPAGYHLTNLFLHIANAVLLFGVLARLTGAAWPSAAVATLFAVHPLHVESVAWASERKDVLSTLFWMLTLGAYSLYVARQNWPRYLLILAAFACGLLAKPMLVTLPCVLLLLDYWPLGRFYFSPEPVPGTARALARTGTWPLVREKLPLFGLALASCVVTVLAQHSWGAVDTLENLPLSLRVANALVAVAGYLAKMVWPLHLAVFYPYPIGTISLGQMLAAGCLLGGVSWAAVRWRRSHPYLLVGWLWYLGTLVPVSGLVQVGAQAMADRYTYVPLIGIFVILAWGIPDLLGRHARPAVLVPAVGVLLVILALLTRNQVRTWKDSRSLWEHAAQVTEKNYMAHLHLGTFLMEEGKWQQAADQFVACLAAQPDHAAAHINLGSLLLKSGDLDGAEQHFVAAARVNPGNPLPYYNLAIVRHSQGRLAEAVEQYEHALRLSPDNADAHRDLAVTLTVLDRRAQARRHLEAALRNRPDDPHANYHLGMVLAIEGKPQEAVPYFRHAVELSPAVLPFQGALALALLDAGDPAGCQRTVADVLRLNPSWPAETNASARGLAVAPNRGYRNGGLAVQLARQACLAFDTPPADFLDTLAAAHAEAGQFDKAIATAQKAIRQAKAHNEDMLAGQIQDRLRLYEQRQPYHDVPAEARPRS